VYKHILIPTDGSETADKAIAAGIEFAREANARITLFTAMPEYRPPSESEAMARHIISPAEHEQRSREEAERIFAAAATRARAAGVAFDTDFACDDHPYEAIVEAAERHGCDAIFMSSHGRRGLSRLLHGSETAAVLSHTRIPTLVYR
jgi:nucleotide-binding universal stress UspA family protein